MSLGDTRLVKYLASLQSGVELLGFKKEHENTDTGTLFVPFKADLPGLYGRAVVLDAGSLPYEDGEFLHYPNVSEKIAEKVFNLLMS